MQIVQKLHYDRVCSSSRSRLVACFDERWDWGAFVYLLAWFVSCVTGLVYLGCWGGIADTVYYSFGGCQLRSVSRICHSPQRSHDEVQMSIL